MARMSVPRWSVYVVVAALIASLSFSLGSIYSAFGDSHDAAYYACLYAGSLSQVGTTPPANCGRGSEISWNSDGIQSSDVVVRRATTETGNILGNDFAVVEVFCEDGEVATGGGFEYGGNEVITRHNHPLYDFSDTLRPFGWKVQATNPTAGAVLFNAYVICASP